MKDLISSVQAEANQRATLFLMEQPEVPFKHSAAVYEVLLLDLEKVREALSLSAEEERKEWM